MGFAQKGAERVAAGIEGRALPKGLIGRVINRPEPGDQAPGGRGDRRGGILKGLVSLLHQGGLILADPGLTGLSAAWTAATAAGGG